MVRGQATGYGRSRPTRMVNAVKAIEHAALIAASVVQAGDVSSFNSPTSQLLSIVSIPTSDRLHHVEPSFYPVLNGGWAQRYDQSLHIIVKGVSSILNTFGSAGWKVAMVLSELGLSYETIFLDFSKSRCRPMAQYHRLKKSDYLINKPH